MSWNFSFVAESRGAAIDHLPSISCPQEIKDFVGEALRQLDPTKAVLVKSSGHLNTGPTSYATSNVSELVVQPLDLIKSAQEG